MNNVKNDELLKNFIDELFDVDELIKLGLLKKEIKGNYSEISKRICEYFGMKTIYEYGAKEIRCHISYAGERPLYVNDNGELIEEPFVTVTKSIYD